MQHIFSFILFAFAAFGAFSLIVLFIPFEPKPEPAEPEPDFAPPQEEHVYTVSLNHTRPFEVRIAQVVASPHFVSFYRADGTVSAIYATPSVLSIVEK